MKIVKIIGGLGNQMFQYALALALRERFPDETVKVDTTLFCNYRRHNGLELERIFGITLDTASPAEINQVSRCFRNYFLQRLWRKILGCGRHEIVQRHDGEFLPETFQAGKDLYYEDRDLSYPADIRFFLFFALGFARFKRADRVDKGSFEASDFTKIDLLVVFFAFGVFRKDPAARSRDEGIFDDEAFVLQDL